MTATRGDPIAVDPGPVIGPHAKVPITMAKSGWRFFVPAILFLFALGSAAQEPKPPLGRLSLPTKNWGVVLDLPGFTVKNVETKPDGTGTVVSAQNVPAGTSVTGYAISRDAGGNFIANVVGTWSLTNVTGGVVQGDLVAAGGGLSATFTGHLVGTATVHVTSGALTPGNSGTLTVVASAATVVNVETAANGSGTVLEPQNVPAGQHCDCICDQP